MAAARAGTALAAPAVHSVKVVFNRSLAELGATGRNAEYFAAVLRCVGSLTEPPPLWLFSPRASHVVPSSAGVVPKDAPSPPQRQPAAVLQVLAQRSALSAQDVLALAWLLAAPGSPETGVRWTEQCAEALRGVGRAARAVPWDDSAELAAFAEAIVAVSQKCAAPPRGPPRRGAGSWGEVVLRPALAAGAGALRPPEADWADIERVNRARAALGCPAALGSHSGASPRAAAAADSARPAQRAAPGGDAASAAVLMLDCAGGSPAEVRDGLAQSVPCAAVAAMPVAAVLAYTRLLLRAGLRKEPELGAALRGLRAVAQRADTTQLSEALLVWSRLCGPLSTGKLPHSVEAAEIISGALLPRVAAMSAGQLARVAGAAVRSEGTLPALQSAACVRAAQLGGGAFSLSQLITMITALSSLRPIGAATALGVLGPDAWHRRSRLAPGQLCRLLPALAAAPCTRSVAADILGALDRERPDGWAAEVAPGQIAAFVAVLARCGDDAHPAPCRAAEEALRRCGAVSSATLQSLTGLQSRRGAGAADTGCWNGPQTAAAVLRDLTLLSLGRRQLLSPLACPRTASQMRLVAGAVLRLCRGAPPAVRRRAVGCAAWAVRRAQLDSAALRADFHAAITGMPTAAAAAVTTAQQLKAYPPAGSLPEAAEREEEEAVTAVLAALEEADAALPAAERAGHTPPEAARGGEPPQPRKPSPPRGVLLCGARCSLASPPPSPGRRSSARMVPQPFCPSAVVPPPVVPLPPALPILCSVLIKAGAPHSQPHSAACG
eukprot:TRINITY_DN16995_c0_g1_i1.p1 TRINITY_DN16995_c0_g1~~TRINITY_DN16995_c0_g1_i1.p1  ORF type:complete len:806 (+),score=123.23 TRINITY_DN16995_c0_g1_i1:79-2418(+)